MNVAQLILVSNDAWFLISGAFLAGSIALAYIISDKTEGAIGTAFGVILAVGLLALFGGSTSNATPAEAISEACKDRVVERVEGTEITEPVDDPVCDKYYGR